MQHEEPFLADLYGVDDIRRWFDAATIRKAEDYGQAVIRNRQSDIQSPSATDPADC